MPLIVWSWYSVNNSSISYKIDKAAVQTCFPFAFQRECKPYSDRIKFTSDSGVISYFCDFSVWTLCVSVSVFLRPPPRTLQSKLPTFFRQTHCWEELWLLLFAAQTVFSLVLCISFVFRGKTWTWGWNSRNTCGHLMIVHTSFWTKKGYSVIIYN